MFTNPVAEAAEAGYTFDHHGVSEVKGVGPVDTCLLVGRRQRAGLQDASRVSR